MRISIRPEWLLERPNDGSGQAGKPVSLPALLQLLAGIQQHGSIVEAVPGLQVKGRQEAVDAYLLRALPGSA